jgi:hypothetical protein
MAYPASTNTGNGSDGHPTALDASRVQCPAAKQFLEELGATVDVPDLWFHELPGEWVEMPWYTNHWMTGTLAVVRTATAAVQRDNPVRAIIVSKQYIGNNQCLGLVQIMVPDRETRCWQVHNENPRRVFFGRRRRCVADGSAAVSGT